MVVGRIFQPQYKTYGKPLNLEIFIKSIISQKNFKLGMVIPWTISIVKKFCCHGNMPGGIQFFGPHYATGPYS